jgi:TolA-binding protein
MASSLKVIRVDTGFVVSRINAEGEAFRVEPEKPPYSTRQAANRRKWQLEAEDIIIILKAQGPGPSYAEIRRVGTSMSNPRERRNHMLLSDEQEQAYQQAVQFVKDGDIAAAESVLKAQFDWVKVEQ